jgi:cell wall-associated NlpC family hydrolase
MGRRRPHAIDHEQMMRVKALVALTAACVALSFAAPADDAVAGVKARKQHLIRRAKSQLGTRYRYGGETPRRGFDCSGFTRWTFKKVTGLPHSSMRQYKLSRKPGYKRIYRRARLHRGDLVFFKTTRAKVGHVGMYIGRGRFIHASSGADKVTISSVRDRYYYGPRFRGAVRVPKLRH